MVVAVVAAVIWASIISRSDQAVPALSSIAVPAGFTAVDQADGVGRWRSRDGAELVVAWRPLAHGAVADALDALAVPGSLDDELRVALAGQADRYVTDHDDPATIGLGGRRVVLRADNSVSDVVRFVSDTPTAAVLVTVAVSGPHGSTPDSDAVSIANSVTIGARSAS